ncbi:MAG: hypothetical protein HY692_04350 [Cyanobacteria bacterium NC_groundwater_1444_Ag_S-0.65um_54_12]|nr:hypothetical protein [Cyanobacteria bacterium NC_groundwater_1444_Ag_S-0.65um_54_12]
MPVVVKQGQITVEVLTRDEHPPHHVHAKNKQAGWKIRIFIGESIEYWDTLAGNPRLPEIYAVIDLVIAHHERACELWNSMAKGNIVRWGYSAEVTHGSGD